MTTHPRLWTTEDGRLLTALREAAGQDMAVLASRNALSVHHVRQLEEGGDDRFYSQAIKLQVGRKLLRSLGGDLVALPVVESTEPELPPPTLPEPLHEPALVLNTRPRREMFRAPKKRWAFSVVGLLGVALAWWSGQWAQSNPPLQKKRFEAIAAQPLEPSAAAAVVPAPPVNPPAEAEVAAETGPCRFGAQPLHVTVTEPLKPGHYVYFEADQSARVCVRDSARQTTELTLVAGRGHTVRGPAPFELMSEQFAHVRVFYQGKRVAPALLSASTVMLSPQEIGVSKTASN